VHEFQDWILNLGLQIALSDRPAPPPEPKPEPVAIVATADVDNDGVSDDKDTCPDTPLGTTVNETGCAPEPPPPAATTIETAKAGDVIVLHGVNFETARATLTANAKTILDDVADKLAARPELQVEIGGHTDSRGSDSYNQALSEQRAASVVEYLVGKGIDGARMSAKGYGESQPIDSNDTDEGRERNRRVEMKVLENQAPAAGTPAENPAAETPAEKPADAPK
jgi:OOP family OmpA-OmpF porin